VNLNRTGEAQIDAVNFALRIVSSELAHIPQSTASNILTAARQSNRPHGDLRADELKVSKFKSLATEGTSVCLSRYFFGHVANDNRTADLQVLPSGKRRSRQCEALLYFVE
jgi:hypothetical protein